MSFLARQGCLRQTLAPTKSANALRGLPGQSLRLGTTAGPKYQYILTSRPAPSVTLITLNRPEALNALCSPLMKELCDALREADADNDIGAIVLTGSEKAFAAGADIKEMKDKSFVEVYGQNFLVDWSNVSETRKPIISAVSGFALGGGCELALMTDIILASPSARFGQPEINLGIIPGGGATQRLTGIIGKSRTMELVLTGRQFTAEEAEKWGVVSKIADPAGEGVVAEAIAMAKKIASKGRLSVIASKEVVNKSLELSLSEGLEAERRVFHGLFATQDQKEGMGAFAEKRKPKFTNA